MNIGEQELKDLMRTTLTSMNISTPLPIKIMSNGHSSRNRQQLIMPPTGEKPNSMILEEIEKIVPPLIMQNSNNGIKSHILKTLKVFLLYKTIISYQELFNMFSERLMQPTIG